MAIKRTFNGATIIKPGAYSRVIVENLTGFPLQPTGVVGIVGEAKGGEPRVLDILSNTQIQDAKARYKSGPIADALDLLVNPSNDPRVANGASTIVVYKTNNSTQSTLSLSGVDTSTASDDLINLTSKNYGADENNINILVSEGSSEDEDANIVGTIDVTTANFTGSEVLQVVAGESASEYTWTNDAFLGGPLGTGKTITEVVNALNNNNFWSGGINPIVAEESSPGSNLVKITLNTELTGLENSHFDRGFISILPSSTLDTLIGLTGQNRGERGSRVFTVKKESIEEVSSSLGGRPQISISYSGSQANVGKIAIDYIGGELKFFANFGGTPTDDDLEIALVSEEGQNLLTLQGLVDLINANPNYVANVEGDNPNRNVDELDHIFRGIAFYSPVAEAEGLVIPDVQLFADSFDFVNYFNVESTLVEATYGSSDVAIKFGYIETFSDPKFLTGATDGSSANSDFLNAFEAFKEERINHVVPLISEDKGSLTVDSINTLADNHVKWGWSTLGKSERNAYVSKKASKEDLQDCARTLNSGYTSIVGQEVRVLDRLGELRWLEPWALACIFAGLDAGSGVGEPITFKFININNLRVADNSWSPKTDFVEMIDAGVLIAEPVDSGGFRCVVGNTTYGIDSSFVFNRISVVEAAGFVAYDLRLNLELAFTGTKARTGTAEAVANFVKARMSVYLAEEIIVGDDLNDGIGYKNLRVNVEGNTVLINISVTPVQGIDFILPTIYLADIRQSA